MAKRRVKKAKKRSAGNHKNSLVANINRRKKKGTSRSKRKSTISKKAYADMKNNWGKRQKVSF